MDWTEIKVTVPTDKTDEAAAIANMTVPYGIYIEDYSELENDALEIAHIDLIDEDLVAKDRTKSIIHMYIADSDNAIEALSYLKERYNAAGIDFSLDSTLVDDADWNEIWKKYFKAFEIGEHLAVCPSWENYDNKDKRTVISIDPGAAFGTGTHATTSLCLELLEDIINADSTVLDIDAIPKIPLPVPISKTVLSAFIISSKSSRQSDVVACVPVPKAAPGSMLMTVLLSLLS